MDMGEAQGRLAAAARDVFEIFKVGNLTLCAAESCTGGLVGSSIVGISGASSIFKGSAVCYCDASKISVLGVRRDTIENCFAESRQCSIEMARGAMRIFGADVAVSTTGFLDANVGGKPRSSPERFLYALALGAAERLRNFALKYPSIQTQTEI